MVKKNNQTVQETNDCSILSKASIAELGYFADPYLRLFTTRVARRAPLIHKGYYVRAKAIDHVLVQFLKLHAHYDQVQIISLGAGFDSSYFRLKNDGFLKNCKYIEVDFPDVVLRKETIINKQEKLTRLVGEHTIKNSVLLSEDYNLVPCDLTNLIRLEQLFSECEIDNTIPTLLFSECVLTYIDYQDSQKLSKWIKEKFLNSTVFSYEQYQPNDAFGQVMLNHFEKIQSPLRRIHELDSLSKHKDFFDAIGFKRTICFDMNFFYVTYISGKEKERASKIELFDEYEEWHLKCSHYCIVTAFQGICINTCDKMFAHQQILQNSPSIDSPIAVTHLSPATNGLKRYGHEIVQLNDCQYLITGGFGVTNILSHDKLKDALLLTCNISTHTEPTTFSYKNVEIDLKRMYHSLTSLDNNLVFIFGGRISPKHICNDYGIYEFKNSSITPINCFAVKDDSTSTTEPMCRWRHAAAKLNDKVFVYGGRTAELLQLRDLWSFDLKTLQWKKESDALPPCHSHTLTVWNKRLVTYGGLTATMDALNQLHIVSFEDGSVNIKRLYMELLLPPRYSHTSHVVKDSLLIVGGIDPTCQSQPPMLLISLTQETWKEITMPRSNPERPLMLHNHCSILRNESEVTIVGGGGNCFSFGTHFNEGLTSFDIAGLVAI